MRYSVFIESKPASNDDIYRLVLIHRSVTIYQQKLPISAIKPEKDKIVELLKLPYKEIIRFVMTDT